MNVSFGLCLEIFRYCGCSWGILLWCGGRAFSYRGSPKLTICSRLDLVNVNLSLTFEWERDYVLLWDFVEWGMVAFFAEECLCTPYLPGSFFVFVDIVVVEAFDMML